MSPSLKRTFPMENDQDENHPEAQEATRASIAPNSEESADLQGDHLDDTTIDESQFLEELDSNALELDLTHCRLKNMSVLGLNRFHRLEHLSMRQNLFQCIAGMDALTSTLKDLDLYDNSITDIAPLKEFVHLNSLDLSFNRIKAIPPGVFSGMKELKELFLVANKISKIEHLDGLEQLTNLELGANRIRTLENLSHLPHLTHLWVGKNKLGDLAGLACLPRLQLLSVQSNRITRLPRDLPATLEELYLSHNGIRSLDGLQHLPRLRILDVCNNRVEVLEHVAGLARIEELWISNNKLSDWHAVETQLVPLPHLHTLYLEGNPLQKDADAKYRRTVKEFLPQLKQLDATYFR